MLFLKLQTRLLKYPQKTSQQGLRLVLLSLKRSELINMKYKIRN